VALIILKNESQLEVIIPNILWKVKKNNAWFQTTNQPVALLPTKSLRVHQEKPWRESTTLRYPREIKHGQANPTFDWLVVDLPL